MSVHSRMPGEISMLPAKYLGLACLLLSLASWSTNAAPPSGKVSAATLKRDSALCRAHADLDACYDALRWTPGDPALLVALGDALMIAQRPSDAIRNYRRAAALAPNMGGVAAKISAAEAKLKRAGNRPVQNASNGASAKHFSNAAPEAQSH
jgi:cytochrome c-type biogenesis protein CcmH/NrfG